MSVKQTPPDPNEFRFLPITVQRLVGAVVNDGGSFHDGLGGWAGGVYDSTSKVLTLHFERDESIDELSAERAGFDAGSFTYRFQLLPH